MAEALCVSQVTVDKKTTINRWYDNYVCDQRRNFVNEL